ncbi:MAG: TetM/TetW/TetO/TetS family tetracycline resistance ribosomal protection protein [Clostridia bacterium]|nr:TetM/TetW/TetO/TetS family tetracycline resistance ribosomal protection protein [Clostridia bacterium]
MKRITAGILAHVDAGKTTLSEGLLYASGKIRKMGRVDNGDSFLDTDEQERKRGITIFSKHAVLKIDETEITLLDTPGHMDFFAETERTVSVFDYAVLVVSGTDSVQSHTITLWNLLCEKNIPVFIFVNKSDLNGFSYENTLNDLKDEFKGNFVDFSLYGTDEFYENIALCDEKAMSEYFKTGKILKDNIKELIKRRKIFPCYMGAALKHIGVEEFLHSFCDLTCEPFLYKEFGARVFKISEDEKGNRLTFIKVTGGSLGVKSIINKEKINEIRIYSGDKYETCDTLSKGMVCALVGPKTTYAGQGLGFLENAETLTAEPIFSYKVNYPKETEVTSFLRDLKKLEEEETKLNISWNERLKEIRLSVMGEVQLEVLKELIFKRYGVDVTFSQGGIIYKETILNTVEGVGHYEPLRHYAEVHLLLEPLPVGSGMQFETDADEDSLNKNWQRLILNHLMEKTHLGVLTGSPVTDIKITLKSGKAHLKHTEGGDFRQATYRAVRHGLRSAKSVVLEPYCTFTIEVPSENIGKVMTDLNYMGAEFDAPYSKGNITKISGECPAKKISDYKYELISFTRGMGKLNTKFSNYKPCKDQEKVIEDIAYDADSDIENTADSIFCSHGAGFNVKWTDVTNYMHLESILKPEIKEEKKEKREKFFSTDEELLKIFENTYGKVKVKLPHDAMYTKKDAVTVKDVKLKEKKYEKEYLLIDGYNIIFAWDDLKKVAKDSLESARTLLTDRLVTYKTFKNIEIIVVFDAYKVKGNPGEKEKINGINIVYTKEAQTADSYIEKTAHELSKNYKVSVATSDALEQMIIFGSGALRMSARTLREDIEIVEERVRKLIDDYNLDVKKSDFFKINLFNEKLTE